MSTNSLSLRAAQISCYDMSKMETLSLACNKTMMAILALEYREQERKVSFKGDSIFVDGMEANEMEAPRNQMNNVLG